MRQHCTDALLLMAGCLPWGRAASQMKRRRAPGWTWTSHLPGQHQGLETQRGGNQEVDSHQTLNLLAP